MSPSAWRRLHWPSCRGRPSRHHCQQPAPWHLGRMMNVLGTQAGFLIWLAIARLGLVPPSRSWASGSTCCAMQARPILSGSPSSCSLQRRSRGGGGPCPAQWLLFPAGVHRHHFQSEDAGALRRHDPALHHARWRPDAADPAAGRHLHGDRPGGGYRLRPVAGRARVWLSRSRIRALEIASGCFLMAGGVWMALRGR